MNAVFLFEPVRELWKRIVNIATGVRDVWPEKGAAMVHAGAHVLDVRDPEEWARGIIPGSILIPLRDLAARADEVAALRQSPVLVVCHGGKRSATACRLLRRIGFSGQVNLAGGVVGWSRAGMDLVSPYGAASRVTAAVVR
jgi:rhodanese-related sulfurtransferase